MRRGPEQLRVAQAEMRTRWQAGRVRVRPGRPPCELDVNLVFVWALNGLTHAEIAAKLGCDPKTLRRHCGRVLQHAARSRAALLPRPLWQRGPNRPDKLAANFADIIQRQEEWLAELEAMLWAPLEADGCDSAPWPDELSDLNFDGRLQTSVSEQQSPEQLAEPKELSREFFPYEELRKKAKKDRLGDDQKNIRPSFR